MCPDKGGAQESSPLRPHKQVRDDSVTHIPKNDVLVAGPEAEGSFPLISVPFICALHLMNVVWNAWLLLLTLSALRAVKVLYH